METGSVASVTVALLGGWAAWTLTEYVAHRWVLHPRGRGRLATAASAEHRMHHRHPLATRLPLRITGHVALWTLALGSVSVVAPVVTGNGVPAPALGFAVGWALGYSVYELGHWRTHHRSSQLRWRRDIRRHHLIHHRDPGGVNYGVTVDWWDRVFGTHRAHNGGERV